MPCRIKYLKHYTNEYSCAVLGLLLFLFIAGPIFSQSTDTSDTWVVVIDPGHGGKDPGAVSNNTYEKNITLAISLKLGNYISTLDNVKVLYTRKSDVSVDLDKRPQFANSNNANIFISIHANWGESSKTKGTETFIMGLAKDEQNLEVAMKENEVILLENDYSTKYEGFDPKSPESYIMFTLTQKEFSAQSLELAGLVQDQFRVKAGMVDRSVKQAGFWVLWGTTMPSILVETGFITNPEEVKFLSSVQGQDLIASAIFRAFRDYKNTIDKKSDFTINQNNVSDTIIFMVQIATALSNTELKPENFKGLNGLAEFKEGNKYKFTAGKFDNYDGAAEYRKTITALFPDAFVVAVKANKIVPLQEALEQLKQK